MISANVIKNWSGTHSWSTREQIEQDFLLSQAICEISNNKILGNKLIIRGGTAFHKLFLPKAYRYSEDSEMEVFGQIEKVVIIYNPKLEEGQMQGILITF